MHQSQRHLGIVFPHFSQVLFIHLLSVKERKASAMGSRAENDGHMDGHIINEYIIIVYFV